MSTKDKQTVSQRIRNAAVSGTGIHLTAAETRALFKADKTVKEAAAEADARALEIED